MKTLTEIWNWLDGKKRIIGNFITVVALAPYLGDYIGDKPVEILLYFGAALGFGGSVTAIAKGLKAAKKVQK
jgi:hypothetical protein